ncbi:MAG: MucB/RseB C-terminal domain-containing protein [Pseudomonadales bacterium]
MKTCFLNLAASCLLFASGAVIAESTQNGVHLLERMSHSVQEQSYDGVFVYKRGDETGVVRVIHVVKDGKEKERVIHLDGPTRELVLGAHDIGCVHSGARLLRAPVAKPSNAAGHPYDAEHSSKLSRYYAFKLTGKSRVAGRPVTKLQIEPRDEQRLGYHLYLDKQSDLLLKSAIVDSKRQVLESFKFTQIKIGDAVNEEDLQPESKTAKVSEYHSLSKPNKSASASGEVAWRAAWIPDGFVMAADAQRKLGDGNMDSMHYTDGLAMFSVFVEPAKEPTPIFEQRQGSTVLYSESKRDGANWHTVTVVGEVPPSTAKDIAKGVRPNEVLAQ